MKHHLLPLLLLTTTFVFAENNIPPAGFTALFNGKDLTGFCGGETFDPRELAAMPEDKRAEKIKGWTDDMRLHWKAEGGELRNDGKGAFATTEKEYGDFELLVEYNMAPKGDSGIYLRNCPQVQIWDHTDPDTQGLGRALGSGGLWNNSPGAPGKDPLVLADKPAGEWNKFRVIMTGSRVSVWLNDKLTVDHCLLENYYDLSKPPAARKPVVARGPICLQTHGAPIQWRNIFIREIPADEANKLLASHGNEGFTPIFNGKDFTGWQGATSEYEIVDGALQCIKGKGGNLFTKDEYADFSVRLQFKLPPGGNNGLAIRYPGQGDPAFAAWTELQVLDNDGPQYAKLDPRQYHGSVYGVAAAQRGYLRPTGEWNFQQATIRGNKVQVELNGTIILQADVSAIKMEDTLHFDKTMSPEILAKQAPNYPHPGLLLTKGFFGFAGHNDPVAFREVEIKKY